MGALVWSVLLFAALMGFYLLGYRYGRRDAEADTWPEIAWGCHVPGCGYAVRSDSTTYVMRAAEAHEYLHREGDRR